MDLLAAKPATLKQFAAWCKASIAYMDGNLIADADGQLDDEFHRFAARLVKQASIHALRIKGARLASVLPWCDTKNAKDCYCRLQECLAWCKQKRSQGGSLLTPPQAAKELGTSPERVREWITAGELKAINLADPRKKRPRFRIERSAVDEFKTMRRANPKPQRVQRSTVVTRYADRLKATRGRV